MSIWFDLVWSLQRILILKKHNTQITIIIQTLLTPTHTYVHTLHVTHTHARTQTTNPSHTHCHNKIHTSTPNFHHRIFTDWDNLVCVWEESNAVHKLHWYRVCGDWQHIGSICWPYFDKAVRMIIILIIIVCWCCVCVCLCVYVCVCVCVSLHKQIEKKYTHVHVHYNGNNKKLK